LWKGEGNITLKKYNSTTMAWDDVVVETGLTEEEKTAWMNEAKSKGKPMIYGRLMFIGENAKRLSEGLDIVRVP
jgi:hypothetical protein